MSGVDMVTAKPTSKKRRLFMVLFLSYVVSLYAECEAQSSPFRAVGLSLERGLAN